MFNFGGVSPIETWWFSCHRHVLWLERLLKYCKRKDHVGWSEDWVFEGSHSWSWSYPHQATHLQSENFLGTGHFSQSVWGYLQNQFFRFKFHGTTLHRTNISPPNRRTWVDYFFRTSRLVGYVSVFCRVNKPGWCSTPTQLLICSSFNRENGHPLLICSSLSTAQKQSDNCQKNEAAPSPNKKNKQPDNPNFHVTSYNLFEHLYLYLFWSMSPTKKIMWISSCC